MIDLHSHTTYSDGSKSVKEILEEAQKCRLTHFSITDHNTIRAYFDPAMQTYKTYFQGEIIPGIEITTMYKGGIVEVLGYGFDIAKMKQKVQENILHPFVKQIREYELIKQVYQKNKFQFDEKNIVFDPKTTSCRKSFWQELMKYDQNKARLYKNDSTESSSKFTRQEVYNPKSAYYVDESSLYPSFIDTIQMIHECGGIAFLAHVYEYANASEIIADLDHIKKNYKLDGIECYHSIFTKEQEQFINEFAKAHGFLKSGGSDFHGTRKPNIFLGVGKGNLEIPNVTSAWPKELSQAEYSFTETTGQSTEKRNPLTNNIDICSAEEIVNLMHTQDMTAVQAMENALPTIAQASEVIAFALRNGGKLYYIGAGTSGRLGILDASECPPTFGVTPDLVSGIIAGGDTAIRNPVEGAEDDVLQGKIDLKQRGFQKNDVLVGIAASGNTPYVLGAMEYAKEIGGFVISLTCNTDTKMSIAADMPIEIVPGPEVITGSTRLKAGTVEKLTLNMFTTTSMILNGKVYQNLMVDVVQSNKKLMKRAISIVCDATGVSAQEASHYLSLANGHCKTAIVAILADISIDEAKERLESVNGKVRKAIQM